MTQYYHIFPQDQEKNPEELIFSDESSVFQVQPEENNFLTYGHLDHNFIYKSIQQDKYCSSIVLFNAPQESQKHAHKHDVNYCATVAKDACRPCRRKKRTIKATIPPLHILKRIYPILHGMTDVQLRILDSLFYWCKSFRTAYPTHQMLADYVGCHVSYIKKTLNKFLDMGLIGQTCYLIKGKANEYALSPIWSWGNIKQQVSGLFNNLSNFFIEQLVSLNTVNKEDMNQRYHEGISNIILKREPVIATLLGAAEWSCDDHNPPPDPTKIKKAAKIADVRGTAG